MAVRIPLLLACVLAIFVLDLFGEEVSKLIVEPNVETDRMGDVDVPGGDVFAGIPVGGGRRQRHGVQEADAEPHENMR